ncbi:MAG TPA: ATP-dependent helicase [Candidatus Limnocylindria bacterium]
MTRVEAPQRSSSISAATEGMLATLDPEQRAAASLPDGPALIIAPAGSGKTTTLIARLGVLLARGVAPERIAVATFNRDAAGELTARIRERLAAQHPEAPRIEVRTLHALARQILLEHRGPLTLVSDRLPILRGILRRAADRGPRNPDEPLPEPAALDTEISALKVEGRPARHPALVEAYRSMLAIRGALDFDDLVTGAADLLERDPAARLRWQGRFSHVCVDEFQDVDAAQLRLIRILAEPQRNLFVVGDDDQTIYAWRLADVRRILSFESLYPGARRVQLATNYRCPAAVVAASRRLVEVNAERYAKRIRAGPNAVAGDAILALDTSAPGWADGLARLAADEERAQRTICFLARTRSELEPMLVALARAGVPHRTSVGALIQAEPVRELMQAARSLSAHSVPFEVLLALRAGRGWRRGDAADALGDDEHAALDALLGWAAGFGRLDGFVAAHDAALERLEALRLPDARVELVTVHAAKGREWQTVVVLGMEEERFPNRRSLVDAVDPARALEEERRLAYVALTRATGRLVLAGDPRRPSRFLAEMGLPTARPPVPPR